MIAPQAKTPIINDMKQTLKRILRTTLTTAATALLLVACDRPATPAKPETGKLGWPEITRENKRWTRWW